MRHALALFAALLLTSWAALRASEPGPAHERAAIEPASEAWPEVFIHRDTCNVYVLREGDSAILFNLGDDLYLTGSEHYTPFDLSPDDKRFIMARVVRRAADRERTFVLVENWFEELGAKVKQ